MQIILYTVKNKKTIAILSVAKLRRKIKHIQEVISRENKKKIIKKYY